MKFQLYPLERRSSFSTPGVLSPTTWLLSSRAPAGPDAGLPPVPTMNWRMPSPVVAVVSFARIARSGTEIVIVGCCVASVVLMVADGGFGAFLEFTPGRRVAILELGGGAPVVDAIPEREDCTPNLADEVRGGFVVAVSAVGDVTRSYHRYRRGGWGRSS